MKNKGNLTSQMVLLMLNYVQIETMFKWCSVGKLWPCSDVLTKNRSLNNLKWCSEAELWPFLAILMKKWVIEHLKIVLWAILRYQNKYRFLSISKWCSEANLCPFLDIQTKKLGHHFEMSDKPFFLFWRFISE